jgi:Ferritin-like
LEATLRIENRSQLIYLLTEAAEIEHGVMCCYLFTAFSLKNSTDEGVTDAQLLKIRSWSRLIRGVAVEEMLHLGAVCNLLTAVGGAPHLRRPNFPIRMDRRGGFHLRLAPFSLEIMEEFIAIEEPDELDGADEKGKRGLPSIVRPRLSDIFSSEREFHTQGRLYHGIEDGLVYLAQKYGEQGLFIGRPDMQTAAPSYFGGLPQLTPVTDLASALEALNVIVVQGEGASRDTPDSHYSKFLTIWKEHKELLAEDPAFQPARPVLSNPYALPPSDKTDTSDLNFVDDPDTAELCNLTDAGYELMIQILGRLFVHAEESEVELRRLSDAAETLMMAFIVPMADLLTKSPAGPSNPGNTAGISFRLSRGATIPTHKVAAWSVFRERLGELSAYCTFLQSGEGAPAVLARIKATLAKVAESLTLETT